MMTECCGGGMWLMGLFGLLVLIVLVLAAAALVKYLRAGGGPTARPGEAPGDREGRRER